jgi:hypothetical protein
VRFERRRTKKLRVAFHFQFANQAGWKCDECRKNGLEERRRCGWQPGTGVTPERVVWARGRVGSVACPVSIVSALSIAWLEEFQAWKMFGAVDPRSLPARTVEAFFVLENELRKEAENAQT